jgi:hypothetical protein
VIFEDDRNLKRIEKEAFSCSGLKSIHDVSGGHYGPKVEVDVYSFSLILYELVVSHNL